jgi:hypothetical protein
LSMIHLFMIPKDVMDRDTKPRPPKDSESKGAAETARHTNEPPATAELQKPLDETGRSE